MVYTYRWRALCLAEPALQKINSIDNKINLGAARETLAYWIDRATSAAPPLSLLIPPYKVWTACDAGCEVVPWVVHGVVLVFPS